MPGRNIYKDYVAESYYHIYNRGVDAQVVFRDEQDFRVFLALLKRYLGADEGKNSAGNIYPSYREKVELLAFCLMPSHFHLFIFQHAEDGMKLLLKSLCVAYGMYFNRKYKRRGPVFEQRYKAVRITDDSYLLHISRYLHLNPKNPKTWEWSSYPYYLGNFKAEWLMPERILDLFDGDYAEFLDEYKDRKAELEEIKHELADH